MSGETMDRGQLLEALKALANPARLRIMEWLRRPEEEFAAYEPIADRGEVGVCVSHIQAKSGLAQSTVSSYMAILERAGLVIPTRVGKWTHYRRDEALVARIGRTLTGGMVDDPANGDDGEP